MKRREWTEEKGNAIIVYSEVMLMVRGCYVAEAVGEMAYYQSNAKTTYADAMEGAKTAAFRRLAKDFGVGLQAWKKGYSEGWWVRKRGEKPKDNPPAGAPVPAPNGPKFGPGWLKEFKLAKSHERLKWLIEEYRKRNPNHPDEVAFGELLDQRLRDIELEDSAAGI